MKKEKRLEKLEDFFGLWKDMPKEGIQAIKDNIRKFREGKL